MISTEVYTFYCILYRFIGYIQRLYGKRVQAPLSFWWDFVVKLTHPNGFGDATNIRSGGWRAPKGGSTAVGSRGVIEG